MIMNKLKMNLALIALAFPLLLCAKTQRIEMDIWHRKHRTPTELFVQIEAFFDDCNKELTIEFAQDWEQSPMKREYWQENLYTKTKVQYYEKEKKHSTYCKHVLSPFNRNTYI